MACVGKEQRVEFHVHGDILGMRCMYNELKYQSINITDSWGGQGH